ncbi:MAG: cyclic pyranopterin monophosphate synthase MoaC [Candidatus Thorarchaeota archaeon]
MDEKKQSIRMVDVSGKNMVKRYAEAVGNIVLQPETITRIRDGTTKKGNVLAVAETAGILAAKHTSDSIPLCHQIPLTSVEIGFEFAKTGIQATCRVSAIYLTGVEMEALTGVTIALLSIWDMVKYLEKDSEGQYPHARLENIRVTMKRKGE